MPIVWLFYTRRRVPFARNPVQDLAGTEWNYETRCTVTIGLLAFAAAPALAADLPVKAPPVPMAPVMNWTGFYIGVNGGYSWGRSSRDLNFFNPLNGVVIASGTGGGRDLDGGVFGGQVGYNWQTANWVFGIETDAQWTGQKGSTSVPCPVAGCFPTLQSPRRRTHSGNPR